MIVHLSAEAEHDLETIGDYIARNNPARPISFLRALREQCLGLGDLPQRFPLVRAMKRRACGVGGMVTI